MTRVQKTLEQQLAELQAKQRQVKARLDQVEARRKTRDLRRRAKGEKAVLQLALGLATRLPAFKALLIDELAGFPVKPEDRDAALWLLNGTAGESDAAALPAARDGVADSGHPAPPLPLPNARRTG